VNCGNAEFESTKQRETTCGYADGVDDINMHAAFVGAASDTPAMTENT
jgi:hypothetical protein